MHYPLDIASKLARKKAKRDVLRGKLAKIEAEITELESK